MTVRSLGHTQTLQPCCCPGSRLRVSGPIPAYIFGFWLPLIVFFHCFERPSFFFCLHPFTFLISKTVPLCPSTTSELNIYAAVEICVKKFVVSTLVCGEMRALRLMSDLANGNEDVLLRSLRSCTEPPFAFARIFLVLLCLMCNMSVVGSGCVPALRSFLSHSRGDGFIWFEFIFWPQLLGKGMVTPLRTGTQTLSHAWNRTLWDRDSCFLHVCKSRLVNEFLSGRMFVSQSRL